MKQIFPAFIAMLLLISCDSSINDANNSTKSDPSFGSTNPSFEFTAPGTYYNADNPFDDWGLLHNTLCAYAGNKLLDVADYNNEALMVSTLRAALLEGAVANGIDEESGAQLLEDLASSFEDGYVEDDAQWLAELSGPPFTEKECHYINQIGSLIKMGIESETVFMDSILALEERIVSETWNLDDNESVALITMSIFKHSYIFWTNMNTQIIAGGGDPGDWNNRTTFQYLPTDIRQVTYYVKIDGKMTLVSDLVQESSEWSMRKIIKKQWQNLKNWLSGDD